MIMTGNTCPVCGSSFFDRIEPLCPEEETTEKIIEEFSCDNKTCMAQWHNIWILADQIIVEDPHGLSKPSRFIDAVSAFVTGNTLEQAIMGFFIWLAGAAFGLWWAFQWVR